MNKYLSSASERYRELMRQADISKTYMISPVSEVDCQIIESLSAIFERIGLESVSNVLDNYKGVKDSEILDMLTNVIIDIDNNKKKSNDKNKKMRMPFFLIDNQRIFYRNIFGYEPWEKMSIDGEVIYGIKLNPVPENTKKVPLYSNHIIELGEDVEYRNIILNNIDQFLREEGFEIIDLSKNEKQNFSKGSDSDQPDSMDERESEETDF